MILALSGKVGSGKDTVSDLTIKLTPNIQWRVIKFADKLKQITSLVTNTSVDDQYTQDGKNQTPAGWDVTNGEIQQLIGSKLREIKSDVWINAAINDVKPNENVIISDLRYRDEAIAIKERGGILIRINGDPANVRKNSTRNLNHQSEIDLDDFADWDFVINNNSSLTELENKVQFILLKLMVGYNKNYCYPI